MNTASTAVLHDTELEHVRLWWVLAALTVMTLPFSLHLAGWISTVAVLLALWRLAIDYRHWSRPHGYVLVLLGLCVFIGVYATYHTFNGPQAGMAMLLPFAALKLMEAHSLRDYFLLMVIAFGIAIANFLYDQTVPLALYMIPATWIGLAALLNVAHPDLERSPIVSLKRSARFALPAVLIAAALFMLFPRIPGPLWALSLPQSSAITGLSPDMSPGSLSKLARSDAIAFRVEFDGPAPPPDKRYWRALVLHDYDGETWSTGGVLQNGATRITPLGAPLKYQLTLAPNNLHALYALDVPVTVGGDARLTPDLELLTARRVTERVRYTVTSYTDYRYGADTPHWLRQRDLQLPPRIDPRARALAARWRATASTPEQIVNDALRMFRTQPFHYTLDPGVLHGPNRIDEFLFTTRRGFCEHYASAFVFLMRAAGIPAHVVIGYQGGTRNPVDGYYVIRQEDAHAWAEVWLGARGWVRVDPTAAVDPARVDQGLAAALPAAELPGLYFRTHPWMNSLRNTWDAVNNGWNQWVLAYGPELQQRFFAHLGLNNGNWLQLALVLIGAIGAILLGLWTVLWWRRRAPQPAAVQRTYLRFCRKLARRGLARAPSEGPLDYARRTSHARPELTGAIQAITALYIHLRYLGTGDLRSLDRQVRSFRP
ncbi:MAG: transglutaminase TgpA family protein [Gammaproteobacteria bacterium]